MLRLRHVLLALALASPAGARAQGAEVLSVDDPAGVWIERLQRRGHLLDLNPTALPYSVGAVREALAEFSSEALSPLERRWADALRGRLADRTTPADARAWAEVGLGAVATNNERLDVLRWTDVEEAVVGVAGVNVYPNGITRLGLAAGPAAGQVGVRLDVFYEDDPDGLDVVNQSLYLRNQEAFVTVGGRLGSATLGTFDRHWGVRGQPAVFLSDNPRPFDAVDLRLGGERLAVRAVVAELDAATLDGRFTGRTGDRSREPSLRRYLVAHRFDWRPRPWLTLAVVESMVSSGVSAAPSLASVLPTSVLSLLNDTPPRNNENNGLVGGLFWLHRGRTTVHGQLVLDDVDVFNAAEPASVALTGGASWAGSGFDLGLSGTLVTARAYNSPFPEQRYLFALRGLGTPFSDYVSGRAYADLYLDGLVPGLTVSPEASFLYQGAGDLRQPYPDNSLPTVGIGDPEQTVRLGARVHVQPAWGWWLRADLGVNRTWNDGFLRSKDALRFVGLVEGGARIRFGGGIGLRP